MCKIELLCFSVSFLMCRVAFEIFDFRVLYLWGLHNNTFDGEFKAYFVYGYITTFCAAFPYINTGKQDMIAVGEGLKMCGFRQ